MKKHGGNKFILLSERSQSKNVTIWHSRKGKIPTIWHSRKGKIMETVSLSWRDTQKFLTNISKLSLTIDKKDKTLWSNRTCPMNERLVNI